MGKAALFLATGFEEIEALSIIDVLRRGGVDLDTISVSGMEDVEGAHGVIVKSDALFFSIDYTEYELFILPGGPGTENLGKHEGLCELLVKVHQEGKKVAAICAAPSVLGQNGILEGKMATCYPGNEEALKGAHVLDQEIVRDGNVITGKGPGVSLKFAFELLKDYLEPSAIEKLAHRMIIH
jgi:4-methyl-5(b-hydroxyethyl)-thiazole monophosphate biosynthesis